MSRRATLTTVTEAPTTDPVFEESLPDFTQGEQRYIDKVKELEALLQSANDRNNQLLTTVSRWKKDYALVRDELLALK